ncbi:DDE-type integrase/transposase/recombinase [Candidatus Woesearchaeota archaeon]|nr:DDE-type integrase/transposase/recombinase [Candidatus Woesearchaeota archaeon]
MHLESKPEIKGRIHYDEKYVKVKKKDCYDLNAIDSKTKYVLAHLFVEKRTLKKCVVFVCDKFENYRTAFNKLFYRVAKLRFGIPIKAKRNGLKHNNNHIERYNQDIKDRIKTMRNFGSDAGAEYFLNLKHIIHNFVNPHMQINGKTPAEAAGIDLKLGRRKLLNIIRRCSKSRHHSLR